MPQILKGFGLSNLETGLLNMIPFGIASVFMIVWGLRADRSGERIWSTALPLALTSLSFALTLLTGSLWITLVLLSLVLLGNYAIKGPFFALATETLPPAQTAAGIAAINTLAHLGTGAITSLIGFTLVRKPLRVGQCRGVMTVFNALRPSIAIYVLSPARSRSSAFARCTTMVARRPGRRSSSWKMPRARAAPFAARCTAGAGGPTATR